MRKRLKSEVTGALCLMFWCAVVLYGTLAFGWLLRENSDAIRVWLIGHWVWIALTLVAILVIRRREASVYDRGFRAGAIYAAQVTERIDNRQAMRLKMRAGNGFVSQ